jgi:hypothetical protein
MSYCVNCGVELAKSEQACPLCGVEVFNPKAPFPDNSERPYPRHVETLMKRFDRKYFATLAGLALIIPIVVTVIWNMLTSGGITWSAYVTGAIALLYIFFAFPFYFKKFHAVAFISADCAAVLLYMFFIESVNGGSWFLGTGLPVSVAASIYIISLVFLFTKKKPVKLLVRLALAFIVSGVLIFCIELILSLNTGVLSLKWSFYAFVPLVVLSLITLVLEHRRNLKEEIKRRLFY